MPGGREDVVVGEGWRARRSVEAVHTRNHAQEKYFLTRRRSCRRDEPSGVRFMQIG
jgi:hypothetical protein